MPRKKVGKLRVYKMSDLEYQAFCQWCKDRGLIPSEVIRELMRKFVVIGLVQVYDLRSIEEIQKEMKKK